MQSEANDSRNQAIEAAGASFPTAQGRLGKGLGMALTANEPGTTIEASAGIRQRKKEAEPLMTMELPHKIHIDCL